jgi:hypothetical protein
MCTEPVTTVRASSNLIRWSGLCLVAVGVLIAGLVIHPDIFETPFARAALEPTWMTLHLLGLAAAVLSLIGLAGLYAVQTGQLGRLGGAGILLAVPGLVLTACLAFFEAVIMPVLARADSRLLAWDGPLLGLAAFRVGAALALLWPFGLCLVGIATWRARLFPRGAAALLAIGAPAFAAFEGPFVPILGVASVLTLAAAHVWLGYAMWAGLGSSMRHRAMRSSSPRV